MVNPDEPAVRYDGVDLGLADITMDYIVVDTLRVPRETFAEIITAWRDRYAGVSAEAMGISLGPSRAHFDTMIANIRDPPSYADWTWPGVRARGP